MISSYVNSDKVNTDLGTLIQNAMTERDVSIRGLAEAIDTTYEYTRMIVNGGRIPSLETVHKICDALHLNREEVERVIMLKKIKSQYGELFDAMPSDLRTIVENWSNLGSNQRKFLTLQVSDWLKKR
jgi:transcriptional regulator with XRE-family HTH domain